jgi:hypothetical protein
MDFSMSLTTSLFSSEIRIPNEGGLRLARCWLLEGAHESVQAVRPPPLPKRKRGLCCHHFKFFGTGNLCLFHLGLGERDVHDGILCAVTGFVVGDDGHGDADTGGKMASGDCLGGGRSETLRKFAGTGCFSYVGISVTG